ncbi:MAG TPA: efflux RND transporter periplasmic adaptor subunit, partial [Opitutus sp.]|nr:efflux RND transporter periplasmic adaptor subunit [Opitutus sp.]
MTLPQLFTAGLCLALVLAGCRRKEPTEVRTTDQVQPVEVTTVARQDLAETLNLVGSVAANESATIRPETTGLVRAIHFEEGQRVKKGDLLVKIDDAELRAQFAQNEARFQLAELNLQRAERLGETQSNSRAEVDRVRSEFAGARSELELIKVRLDRSEIRAPFDGVLGARTLSPGDYVTSQSVITTIDDLSRLKIDFQVPERFAAKVRPGTVFKVGSAALPPGAELNGEVYFVASIVDRETRSSEVKGYVNAGVPGLKPGMFANVELVLDVREGVLTVPEGSILTTTAGTQIVVVKEEGGQATADFVPVRTGLRSKGHVQVEAPGGRLTEGTKVVASGVGALIL